MGKPFYESGACSSRVHCAACRDLEGGRAWRQSLACCYTMPDGSPDFACPFGGEWGNPPPSRGLGDKVAKAIHAVGITGFDECGGCRGRQGTLNSWFPSQGGPGE